MEVIVWIIATIVWAVAYAIAEIRLNNLKSKYYDALRENIDLRDRNLSLEKKNIVLEAKINALDKERDKKSTREKTRYKKDPFDYNLGIQGTAFQQQLALETNQLVVIALCKHIDQKFEELENKLLEK